MIRTVKRLLILALVFFMSFSHWTAVRANDSEDADQEDRWVELNLTELDHLELSNQISVIQKENENGKTLHSAEHKDEDIVRVTIVFDDPSVMEAGFPTTDIRANHAAMNYRKDLLAKQAVKAGELRENITGPFVVKRNLSIAVNAISAETQYGNLDKILESSNVKEVILEHQFSVPEEPETEADLQDLFSQRMIGAPSLWEDGFTGAGTLIAIIDTGIDPKHISFDSKAFDYAIKELDPDGTKYDLMPICQDQNMDEDYGITGRGYSLNSKIPYAYNYVDGNMKINHLEDSQGNHGSHVAGIAAANRYVPVGENEYADSYETVGTVGVAPDAQLCIMKVFGENGGAFDSDIALALEDALLLGCDVANLSLGSNFGSSYDSGYSSIYKRVMTQTEGMIVNCSAGNYSMVAQILESEANEMLIEDVRFGTVGWPSVIPSAFSVASANNIGITGFGMKVSGKTVVYSEVTYAAHAFSENPGEYKYIYVNSPYDNLLPVLLMNTDDLEHTVLIVNFESSSYLSWVWRLREMPLVGLIFVSEEDYIPTMSLSNTGFYTNTQSIGVISKTDGEYIYSVSSKHNTQGYEYGTGTLEITDQLVQLPLNETDVPRMSGFSSWGVPTSLLLKPEITAPGGNIYSVFAETKDHRWGKERYGLMSGTSMAAPNLTGITALLRQYLREKNITIDGYSDRAIAQSLLMSTALPMKTDGEYYPVMQQGAGLADVSKAVSTRTVIMMDPNDDTLTAKTNSARDGKVKAELGDDPQRRGEYAYSFRIYNISDEDVYFANPKTDVFTQDHAVVSGYMSMLRTTVSAGNQTGYTWSTSDSRKILEYVAGNIPEEEMDYERFDIDGDRKITSYDAYLLMTQSAQEPYVPAGGYADVRVSIHFEDDPEIYVSGAYVEGYTYLTELSGRAGEEVLSHSIPVLGFCGDWSLPTMYDEGSTYLYNLYGINKPSYQRFPYLNSFTFTLNDYMYDFLGNPYAVEDQIPYERFALNSSAVFSYVDLALIAGSAGSAYVIGRVDELGGTMTKIDQCKQNFEKLSFSSFQEGDKVRFGYYAIPDYTYAKEYDPDMLTNYYADSQMLDNVEQYLETGGYREGWFTGFDVTIDNTAPVIKSAQVNEADHVLRIEAEDNQNIAYMVVYTFFGDIIDTIVPAQSSTVWEIDLSEYDSKPLGGVYISAFDYATNRTDAYAVLTEELKIEKELSGIVTDPEGNQYIAEFNTFDLELKNMIPVDSSVGTADSFVIQMDSDFHRKNYMSTKEGKIFAVSDDLSTYTYLNSFKNPMADVACAGIDTSFKFGLAATTKGLNNIYLCSLETGEQVFRVNLGDWNFGMKVISIASCYYNSDSYLACLYVLNEKGEIWLIRLELSGTADESDAYGYVGGFKKVTGYKIVDTGINTAAWKEDLYADGSLIYWAHRTEDKTEMYAIIPSQRHIQKIGEFDSGWQINSLFEKNRIAGYCPKVSLTGPLYTPVGKMRKCGFGGFNIDSREVFQIMKVYPEDDTIARIIKNGEEIFIEGLQEGQTNIVCEIDDVYSEPTYTYCAATVLNDSLNGDVPAVNSPAPNLYASPQQTPAIGTVIHSEFDDVVLEIGEETAVTNGFFTIDYVPWDGRIETVESDLAYIAQNVDEDSGTVRIAYASPDPLEAGEVLASLRFTFDRCADSEIKLHVHERNEELELKEVRALYHGEGHDWHWGKVDWYKHTGTWEAYALFHCAVCGTNQHQQMPIISVVTDKLRRTTYTAKLTAEESMDGEEHVEIYVEKPTITPVIKPWKEKIKPIIGPIPVIRP